MKDISIIPQDPTNEQITEALHALTHAMCNLSAIWGNANDNQDDALCNRYFPFEDDGFDDILTKTIEWANATKDLLERGEK
ncbi:MAG: hypothetical protein K0R18_268 [Bacillales bacterium]|jgi:hypothetical protein|nr:hypothetical protein [Bacillales bacterium]